MKPSHLLFSACSTLLVGLASADPAPTPIPIPGPTPVAQWGGRGGVWDWGGRDWPFMEAIPPAWSAFSAAAARSSAAAAKMSAAKALGTAFPKQSASTHSASKEPAPKQAKQPALKPGMCNCPELKQLDCIGSQCECENEKSIVCFISLFGKCEIDVKNCATPKEPNNLPTPLVGPFPPCGRPGLANCSSNRTCKPLEHSQSCPNNNCLGICVPPISPHGSISSIFPLQGYSMSMPKAGSTSSQMLPPPPGGQNIVPQPFKGCPQSVACPAGSLCVADPRTKGPVAAQALTCLIPKEFCAGFKNEPCSAGKTCMVDPRLKCQGDGCTGICV